MQKNQERILFTGADVWVNRANLNSSPHDILVVDGKIEMVETSGNIAHDPPAGTRIIKLNGGLLMPPFFDGHIHIEQGGRLLRNLQLLEIENPHEVLNLLTDAEPNDDEWLIAIGLHENAWPTIEDINRATADKPVLIYTRDYHSAILNKVGIDKIGLTAESELPDGGWQELDERGNPLGILRENAVTWTENRMPARTAEDRYRNITQALDYLAKFGIMGGSDAGKVDDWPIFEKLSQKENFPWRIECWVRCLEINEFCINQEKYISDNLRRNRIKLFMDGALGSRTAWMNEPYTDKPDLNPGPVPDLDKLESFTKNASDDGWAFAVHAIGDSSVDFTLKLLSEFSKSDTPNRIEHVQHVSPNCLERKEWDHIIPSIQPLHRLEDEAMLEKRVGKERAQLSYPGRSMLRKNRPIAFGSDWPIVSPNPFKNIKAAISPRDNNGMPGEEFSIREAVAAITYGSAVAAGFNNLGKIQKGYSADFIWLAENPEDSIDAWASSKVSKVWKEGSQILNLK